MNSKAIGIIPARFKSMRLPGKPLILIEGKSLLYHVYTRSSKAKELNELIIATDDERIYNEAIKFGATVIMTSPFHKSGTERIAEVSINKDAEIVINIQVDEIFIRSEMIDSLVKEIRDGDDINMATFCTRITDLDELDDPNVVKVVMDIKGYAIYFSRNAIPYPMLDGQIQNMSVKELVSYKNDLIHYYKKHIGIYAYKREFLLQYAQMKPTQLEKIERLEQLRAIEHRVRIKVLETDYPSIGIDTEQDLKRVQSLIISKPDLLSID